MNNSQEVENASTPVIKSEASENASTPVIIRFLDECETACDELKKGVDDIETLYAEYGYVIPGINGNDNSQEVENASTPVIKSEAS
ncbi:hypothetical protein PV328_011900, partial [Microctonus aethiopoides]